MECGGNFIRIEMFCMFLHNTKRNINSKQIYCIEQVYKHQSCLYNKTITYLILYYDVKLILL